MVIENVFVYGKLRFCVRGFSEGKSDVTKQATTFKFSLNQQFFIYGVGKSFLFYSRNYITQSVKIDDSDYYNSNIIHFQFCSF